MSKMIIGIPKEIKDHEYRVGATPAMVRLMTQHGAIVWVESMAGSAIGYSDEAYKLAGAHIVSSAKKVYEADMIIKVKEPQLPEFPLMHEGQILFCYLHLAPDPIQAKHLMDKKVIAIAYETVLDSQKRLPLLVPMSEIAGRIAIHAGASKLHMDAGGKGLLLGGVPGVAPAKVVVLGGGVSGTQALRMALGLGAEVTVLDMNVNRLAHLEERFGPGLKTIYSTPDSVEEYVSAADLVIGSVLIPGKKAPKLVTRELLKNMGKGSVIVDISIDQGGCCETSRPTTHSNPTYVEEGVVHYCVTNMPGACAKTATQALTNATMPYALKIIQSGVKDALNSDSGFLKGVNVAFGKICHPDVALDLHHTYVPAEDLLDLKNNCCH